MPKTIQIRAKTSATLHLQAQVKEGDAVPLTLVVENKDGSRQTLEVTAPARALNAPMKMQHGKH